MMSLKRFYQRHSRTSVCAKLDSKVVSPCHSSSKQVIDAPQTRPVATHAAAAVSSSSAPSSRPAMDMLTVPRTDDFCSGDTRPVILFDGVCNLCNNAVDLMLRVDPEGRFRLAALQSPAGRRLLQRSGRAADDITSIVLVESDKAYIKSDAVLLIASRLGLPLPLISWIGLPMPHFIRDPLYDLVADNRYSLMGKRSCRLMEEKFKERFIVD